MQFSTRQTNFYTLLLFISFDARTSTLQKKPLSGWEMVTYRPPPPGKTGKQYGATAEILFPRGA